MFMIMSNKVEWKKSQIDYDKLSELTHDILSKKINGLNAALNVNNKQGQKNVENGHMKKIQKIGCSIGGKKAGLAKSKEFLKQIGKLGNDANAEKYGVRIYATNLNTNQCWEYISIREAERDLKIQAPIIRKILKGKQSKTRCGWTFEYKK